MFIVEGNIGAGKTTFLRLIKEKLPEISVIFEPVQTWQHEIYGQSILAHFYQDPFRWAYTMESLTMACRVQEHLIEQENPNPFRLMERSIYSGHYVFATNDYNNGYLSTLEWHAYLELFNFLVTSNCKAPHGFIYLKIDPEKAYERIAKRSRSGESAISLDYLRQVHECHENFLIRKKESLVELSSIPVLTLDCTSDFEDDALQFEKHLDAVKHFIYSTVPLPQQETMPGKEQTLQ